MIMTLADMHPGQSARVLGLRHQSSQGREVRKFLAMGLVPGVEIKLVQRFPAFVFEMGFSQFAMDYELASEVLVKIEEDEDDSD